MRAIYKKDIQFEEGSASLRGEQFHHLVNVVRVKEEDTLLVLNGSGDKYFCTIKTITKKNIFLELVQKSENRDNRFIDLLLAPPKKEAYFEILKNGVELNVRKIQLLDSKYSQRLKLSKEKIDKILQGAYEQSNCAFETEVVAPIKFDQIQEFLEQYDHIFFFTTLGGAPLSEVHTPSGTVLVIIGPEGGFSKEEDLYLSKLPKVQSIQFDTNIMRSQTAVTAAMGYLQYLRKP